MTVDRRHRRDRFRRALCRECSRRPKCQPFRHRSSPQRAIQVHNNSLFHLGERRSESVRVLCLHRKMRAKKKKYAQNVENKRFLSLYAYVFNKPHNPKSLILSLGGLSEVSSMFSGFKSLLTTQLECMCFTPRINCRNNALLSPSDNFPLLSM